MVSLMKNKDEHGAESDARVNVIRIGAKALIGVNK